MSQCVLGGMRDRKFGRVVSISSVNGQKGQADQANYSAAKAGDLSFTKALPQDGARAYAPELNLVENVWQFLRANWHAISVFDGYDTIVAACCAACNRFADDPALVASITSRQWAQVNA